MLTEQQIIDEFLNEQGQIYPNKVEDLLVLVCSGKYIFDYKGELFASIAPDIRIQNLARIIYTRRMADAKNKGILDRKALEKLAVDTGAIPKGDLDKRANLLGMMERYHRAKEKTVHAGQRVELERSIENTRKHLIELEVKNQPILRYCQESLAEDSRVSYLVANCTFTGELLEDRVWESWEDFQNCNDGEFVVACTIAYHKCTEGLPNKVVRALSRTGEWRLRWKTTVEANAQPFEGVATDWDRNKRALIYWSHFYDQIFQHPECPDEGTVQDDDALQMWLNTVSQKNRSKGTGTSTRKTPTYVGPDGRRHNMHKMGSDKNIRVNQSYKIPVNRGNG